MTAMAQRKLVNPTASDQMRALLAEAVNPPAVGSYIKDALAGAGRPFKLIEAKKGFGDDSSSHECGIVERTVGGKTLTYVVVGLGSLAAQNRQDLSDMFVLLDEAIVTRNA